jgi:hypothetical protein
MASSESVISARTKNKHNQFNDNYLNSSDPHTSTENFATSFGKRDSF